MAFLLGGIQGEDVMGVPEKDIGGAGGVGILRLRSGIRFANRTASLRMTGVTFHQIPGQTVGIPTQRKPRWVGHPQSLGIKLLTVVFLILLFFLWCATSQAATYYVSSSSGSDGNNGTSSSTPWQTIAHVNAQTFLPGDSVLLKRGDVWNESLVPPTSGTSGNPIAFDAYGAGPAPNLTGYYAMPATTWVNVTGNVWKAPVPPTYTTVNFCLFGSIWGQKVDAVSSNLTAPGDFYLANGYLYVYPL
jgi:hypothetical protein